MIASGSNTGVEAFAYRRSLAPMLWALIALSCGELLLAHLLVALLWSRWVALVLSLVTLGGIVWLVTAIRSFARLPVTIGTDGILLRAGSIKAVRLPIGAIAGVRETITAEEARQRDVLRLSLLAHPNIVLDLAAPIAVGRRRVRAVAHRLDEPAAFLAALDRRRRGVDGARP